MKKYRPSKGGVSLRILVIEDDVDLSELIEYTFINEKVIVDTCTEGDEGLRLMKERAYDLVLLDRMLPRLDGLSVIKAARADGIHTPVLMMTALGQINNVVDGLESGADDYIVKPFHMQELVARVHALSRRPTAWTGKKKMHVGNTTFHPTTLLLSTEKKELLLSKKEAAMIEFFFRHPNTQLPRSSLLSYVWGPDAPIEEGNLENYVYFVRRQLKNVDSNLAIKTVRGIGYTLVVPHV